MTKPNIIFLDFDGVICNPSTCIAVGDTGGCFSYIDPTSALLVRKLCEEHNCKIVVSSTWRKFYDKHAIEAILSANCPRLGRYVWNDETDWRTKDLYDPLTGGVERGVEIENWIRHNSDLFYKFVILDDNSDMANLHDSFVQTDAYRGFGYEDYRKAVAILND